MWQNNRVMVFPTLAQCEKALCAAGFTDEQRAELISYFAPRKMFDTTFYIFCIKFGTTEPPFVWRLRSQASFLLRYNARLTVTGYKMDGEWEGWCSKIECELARILKEDPVPFYEGPLLGPDFVRKANQREIRKYREDMRLL